MITSGQFKCYMIKKGSVLYMCLINTHVRSQEGEAFLDDFGMKKSSLEINQHILLE